MVNSFKKVWDFFLDNLSQVQEQKQIVRGGIAIQSSGNVTIQNSNLGKADILVKIGRKISINGENFIATQEDDGRQIDEITIRVTK